MDGAVSYAEHCIRDFSERTETFATSHVRYGVVLRIRCAAKQQEEEEGAVSRQNDDNGSLYSVATDLSNTILRSTMSGYSVGSVTSVSSVISAGGISTFSMTSEDDVNKHKSKYNKICN